MYNYKNVKKMQSNYQEIATMVAKCEELLAPLYAQLEALKEEEMPDFSEDVEILRNEGLLK